MQTKEYDLAKKHLPGIKEHKMWRDETGGPFIEVRFVSLINVFLLTWC